MDTSKHKDFISKYIKSFTASRYRYKEEDYHIINNILPQYLLSSSDIKDIDFTDKIFFEIGSGCGDFIVNYAKYNDHQCIGCDAYHGGLIQTIKKMNANNLSNIKLFYGDGRILLDEMPDFSIDLLSILFPDPWPKRKHSHRRIINIDYIDIILSKLKQNGIFLTGTDDSKYQEHMRLTFSKIKNKNIEIIEINGDNITEYLPFYINTKYHNKAIEANRKIIFFIIKNLES